ncbi:MAG: hypothetical protein FJY80_09870 [Candidatus Aminicenantes bacterium]|nr:hypothetical protein [Candidatus Aminicenantes bacterium]
MRDEGPESEGFGELLKYTVAGYAGGLALGGTLDALGYSLSAIGQWLVRTLAGEGDSLFEGAYALRRRLSRSPGSLAEAYGWGKLAGMAFPWVVDWGSRLAGIDVYGWSGFYIPYLYAMSDQVGANISGLVYYKRKEKRWPAAWRGYFGQPVMVASLAVILAVPFGLLGARLLGFRPSTQVRTAIETIAANLCWIPPLVGWLKGRRRASPQED